MHFLMLYWLMFLHNVQKILFKFILTFLLSHNRYYGLVTPFWLFFFLIYYSWWFCCISLNLEITFTLWDCSCLSFKHLHYLIFILIIQIFYYELDILELCNRRTVFFLFCKRIFIKYFLFYFMHVRAAIWEKNSFISLFPET